MDDTARGIVAACRLGLSGVYNLAAPEFFRRDHLARHFFRTMDVPATVVARPQSAFDFADPRPQYSYLDSTRFAAATGLRFTTMSAAMARFRARALRRAPVAVV